MQPAGTHSGRPDERFDRPRFRQDLFAELVDEQGARFIDVMDPDSGNLFRFYEVEYSLACGMDGERDVPGIVKWAQEELGLTPSQQEVRSVIATLGELGFIDAAPVEAAQPDLVPGVVVGAPPRASAQGSQVDLGVAGGAAPQRTPPLTPAPDFALGAPGAAARRAAEPVEEVPLGAPGRGPARPTPTPGPAVAAPPAGPDMSLDLADHIPVGRADVQEAVRASKVMAAVEVPASMLDQIEDRPASPAASSGFDTPPGGIQGVRPGAQPAVPGVRDQPRPPEVRVGKPPLTRAPSGVIRPPVELPRPPAPPTEPAAAPAPSPRISPIVVVLVVLAVLSVAAYLVSRYVFAKPEPVESSAAPVAPLPVAPAPPPPAPPPPPPPITSKIALETPPVDEVKTDRPGTIETILADKSSVKAGDVIAKLVGNKQIEAELAVLNRDMKRLQAQIDAATQRRAAATTKAAETTTQNQLDNLKKNFATKQDQLATKTTDLDKFLMHAPSSGTFTPAIKLNKKIAASDVVGTIQRDPTPVAVFQVPDVKPYATNASVELGVGSGEQRVMCTVAAVQAGSLKVACPADPPLSEGTPVTLRTAMARPEVPSTDTAAPAGAPAGTPSGSAAEPPQPQGAPGSSEPPGGSAVPPAPAGSGS